MRIKLVRPQRLPNGTWLTQLRDPQNPKKRIAVRGDTEADCIARVERVRAVRRDLALGVGSADAHRHLRALAEGPFTVKRAWDDYVAAKDLRARRQNKNAWENFFAEVIGDGRPLHELTAEVMGEWETSLAERGEHRVSTLFTQFAMLRAAVRKHVPTRIPDLPFGKWVPTGLGKPKGAKRAHLRSIEELRAYLLAARRRDANLRLQWTTKGYADLEYRFAVAFMCGLRNGELGGLGWDDIYFDDHGGAVMTIRHQVVGRWRADHPDWSRPLTLPKGDKKGKGASQRVHHDAVAALLAQREQLRARGWYRHDGPVFPNSHDGEWRGDECTIKPDIARKVLVESGIEGIDVARFVVHSTRHTFASLETAYITSSGGSLRDAGERTRHKDLRTLEVYMHPLGVGMQAPLLPRLEIEPALPLLAEAIEVDPEYSDLTPPPRVELLTQEAGRAIERKREIEQIVSDEQRYAKGGGRSWKELHAKWVAEGRKGRRPAEVTHDFEKKYMAAYNAEIRRSGDKELARKAGFRSKRGSVGRWERLCKLLEGGGLAKGKPDGGETEVEVLSGADSGRVRGALHIR